MWPRCISFLEDWGFAALCEQVFSLLGELRSCMPMIRERHPQVAKQFAASFEGHPDTLHLREASEVSMGS